MTPTSLTLGNGISLLLVVVVVGGGGVAVVQKFCLSPKHSFHLPLVRQTHQNSIIELIL